MMGLLDQFSEFAKSPEGQGLLSAAFGGLAGARRGEPINSLGRAGLAGMAGYSGAMDRQQQVAESQQNQQYRGMQMDKMRADIEAQRKHAEYLAMFSNPQGTGAASGAGNSAAHIQGGMSRIPQSAIQADIALNGGKNVSEWLFKMGMPDMQVSNGYVFDKNSVQPGYLPGMSVSNDGKATQTIIGPDGQPQVRAPAGAVELFSKYQDVAERAKASYDPQTITLPDGRTVITNRANVVAPAGQQPQPRPGQPFPSGYAGGSASAADAGRLEILSRELTKAQREGRAQDVEAIQRELSRIPGGQAAQAGLPVPGLQVQSEAEKIAAVTKAKADAEVSSGLESKKAEERKKFAIESAQNVISAIDGATDLVGHGTAGFASILSGINGTSAKNLAAKLETVKANLGFDRLQQMRDMSPTGGALGSVAVQELTALQSTVSSLDQGQDPEQLKASLSKIKMHYEKWRDAVIQSAGNAPDVQQQNTQSNGKASTMSSNGWSATIKK